MTIDDRPWEAEYYEIINSHREYHLPEEEEDESVSFMNESDRVVVWRIGYTKRDCRSVGPTFILADLFCQMILKIQFFLTNPVYISKS